MRSRLGSSTTQVDAKRPGDASEVEEERLTHPLLQVVSDLVGQRVLALQKHGPPKPSLGDLIASFEQQMMATEFSQKQVSSPNNARFDQSFGANQESASCKAPKQFASFKFTPHLLSAFYPKVV